MSAKRSAIVFGFVVVISLVPAFAQAPDCTGISDVSDYDGANVSDFDGDLATVLVASGLSRPLFATSPPGDVDRLFIVEQDGLIKILRFGVVLPTPFLNIAALVHSPDDGGGNEEGLLGLAFHPDYDTNGWFFVYHTHGDGSANVVARYTVSANPDAADPTSRAEVITIPHPTYADQDGGMLAFNPHDGYLYIGSGDGGGDCDPADNAQSLSSNLGKLLRLNVDSLPPSTAGNPYDGATAGNDEIWSYGLRNPWRFAIDRVTGVILIGDVGESFWEEINCQTADSTGGENYGWKRYEGSTCPSPSPTCTSPGSCFIPNYQGPIREYNHAEGGFSCSVTGGFVYRGCRMSDLHGTYFYAEYCNNFIRSFRVDEDCDASGDLDRSTDLGAGTLITQITSFGVDARGEMYVIDRAGEVFKILPTLSIMEVSAENAPSLLCYGDGDFDWENLEETSGHSISSQKVYRSDDDPSGPFVCVHETTENYWTGGDPQVPGLGSCFYYLVTALNAAGEETRVGTQSDGAPRDVEFDSECP
jgi:hypothetical protein